MRGGSSSLLLLRTGFREGDRGGQRRHLRGHFSPTLGCFAGCPVLTVSKRKGHKDSKPEKTCHREGFR